MLVAAVAAVTTIDQEVYAFVTPIPTASVSTVASAGIKTMILKRCASAAPTKKLTVESTSTFGLPYGFAAGRLLPDTLILREGDSRYTTGLGIKIPIPIPENDLGHRIPAEFRRRSVSGSRAALLGHTSLVGRFGHCVPKCASRLTIDRWGPPPHTWRCGRLHARVLCGGSGYLAPGRSQNWIKSRPLAMMRSKVDPPCRR
jgi:hypothetical protein